MRGKGWPNGFPTQRLLKCIRPKTQRRPNKQKLGVLSFELRRALLYRDKLDKSDRVQGSLNFALVQLCTPENSLGCRFTPKRVPKQKIIQLSYIMLKHVFVFSLFLCFSYLLIYFWGKGPFLDLGGRRSQECHSARKHCSGPGTVARWRGF